MTGLLLKMIFAAAVCILFGIPVQAQGINKEICQSYINTYCLRCHPAGRICEGLGVKNNAQWQDTIKLMGEYGNLDREIQNKVYACLSSEDVGSFALCVGESAAAGRPKAMTVATFANTSSAAPAAGEKIFRSVSPEEALRMLQARDDVIFLDVRTARERSSGAIPGSKLVSMYALLKGNIPLPKDKPILLVCAVGGRSYMAGQVLSRSGYREVYNLSGGVQEWSRVGLPLIREKAAARN